MGFNLGDIAKLSPVTAISLPPGYEAVYQIGGYYSFPIIAATFQNDLTSGPLDPDQIALPLLGQLWEIACTGDNIGIQECTPEETGSHLVGIKVPGQTLEDFIQKAEEEAQKLDAEYRKEATT